MAMTEDEKAVQGIKDPTERKKAYYTRQRQKASIGSAESKKIHSKMNLGDDIRGFANDQMQKIMASGPWSIGGEAGAAADAVKGAASRLIPSAGKAAESEAAEGVGSKALVPRRSTSGPPAKSYQHLGSATPVKKALPSKGRALGSSKGAPEVGSGSTTKALSSSKGPKALPGGKQKALSTSSHHDYNGELARLTKRSKIPGGKKGAVKGSRKKAASQV